MTSSQARAIPIPDRSFGPAIGPRAEEAGPYRPAGGSTDPDRPAARLSARRPLPQGPTALPAGEPGLVCAGTRAVSSGGLPFSGRELGVRADLHTEECERRGADLSGIGVHIVARILDSASEAGILISNTVKNLVVGSGENGGAIIPHPSGRRRRRRASFATPLGRPGIRSSKRSPRSPTWRTSQTVGW